jgi:hypothetical protein
MVAIGSAWATALTLVTVRVVSLAEVIVCTARNLDKKMDSATLVGATAISPSERVSNRMQAVAPQRSVPPSSIVREGRASERHL